MDAIQYLRHEHANFRQQLAAIGKTADNTLKKKKFNAFCKQLVRHETMEQKIWYPVLRKDPELRNIIQHLIDEEKSAASAIKKFKNNSFEFIWNLRFYKFRHDVNHHAREEEQALFPLVRKKISKTVLNTLGVKMRKFKKSKPV